MITKTGKFNFTVPQSSPVESERGEKSERSFEYEQVETDSEVSQYLESHKTTVIDIIRDLQKSNARANAYQAALAPHKVSEVSQEDIVERMVRDYIRLGIAESVARNMVLSALSAK